MAARAFNIGRCSGCGLRLRSPGSSVQCPKGCRARVVLRPVKHSASRGLTKCGAACERATSRHCDCVCGGRNHGRKAGYYIHGDVARKPLSTTAHARIEMTCIELPDQPTKQELSRTTKTKAERRRAAAVAARLRVNIHTPEHDDDGVHYGDGYLYPMLSKLEPTLDALDHVKVGYDNIDLPIGTPPDLIARLRQRYPAGSGVRVNLNYCGMIYSDADAPRSQRPTVRTPRAETLKYKGFTIKVVQEGPNDWTAEKSKKGDPEGYMPSFGPTREIAIQRAKDGIHKILAAIERGDAARQPQVPAIMYHLTDRARFKLDPKHAPVDNSIAIVDRSGRPGVYLSDSVERWVNGYGYWRPFVVEFKVDPSVVDDPGVHGRWGGELFVPSSSFGKLTVLRVIPLDAHAREQFGAPGWIEDALGVEFDTGKPIPSSVRDQYNQYRGYRYSGPDVRKMPTVDAARLKRQLRQVKG